jgi:hypothetical protein
MLHFCTLFDKHYLSRGIVLIESLQRCSPSFTLYVLCLDEDTFHILQKCKYANIRLIRISELEQTDNELYTCQYNRSRVEYYFTLSPCLPLYILEHIAPNIDFICSLDADLCFYHDPSVIFEDFDKYSILITAHHFHEQLDIDFYSKYGIYNVSFQAFKNNLTGIACLKYWRQQCIEWCYDYVDAENNRFADQRYLDNWVSLFKNEVKIVLPNTEGVAPWNINSISLAFENNKLMVKDKPLIYYHFQGLRLLNKYVIIPSFYGYNTKNTLTVEKYLYLPYIKSLQKTQEQFSNIRNAINLRFGKNNTIITLINSRIIYLLLGESHLILLNFTVLCDMLFFLNRTYKRVKSYLH